MKTGNTTSSSIPIILKKKEKSFKKNSKILMVAFGGGLSWSICLAKKNLIHFFRYNHFTIFLRSVSDSIRVIKSFKNNKRN